AVGEAAEAGATGGGFADERPQAASKSAGARTDAPIIARPGRRSRRSRAGAESPRTGRRLTRPPRNYSLPTTGSSLRTPPRIADQPGPGVDAHHLRELGDVRLDDVA